MCGRGEGSSGRLVDTSYAIWLTSHMSMIVDSTATAILEVFAGQTVTLDAISEQIEYQYAAARKRSAFGSYIQILNALERAGVDSRYTGPNYTGDLSYTFPIKQL